MVQSPSQRASLLQEARSCFNRASGLEKGYRQGLALLGQAVCHHLLDDRANCKEALKQVVELPPAITEEQLVAAILRSFGPREGQTKQDYYGERILSAIHRNPEATNLLKLQECVQSIDEHYVIT